MMKIFKVQRRPDGPMLVYDEDRTIEEEIHEPPPVLLQQLGDRAKIYIHGWVEGETVDLFLREEVPEQPW